MPCLWQSSATVAPASLLRGTPMTCSSVNLLRFIPGLSPVVRSDPPPPSMPSTLHRLVTDAVAAIAALAIGQAMVRLGGQRPLGQCLFRLVEEIPRDRSIRRRTGRGRQAAINNFLAEHDPYGNRRLFFMSRANKPAPRPVWIGGRRHVPDPQLGADHAIR